MKGTHGSPAYPNERIADYKGKLKPGDVLVHDSSIGIYDPIGGTPAIPDRPGRAAHQRKEAVYRSAGVLRVRVEAGCAGGGQGEGANGALSNYAERFTLTIHQNIDKICRAERSVLKLIDRTEKDQG